MLTKLPPKYHYAGVYMIRNKRNGKVYIGSSTNIEKRLADHRSALARGKHPCKDMQVDYDNNHPMTTHVLYVEAVESPDILPDDVYCRVFGMETKYIKQYNAIEKGYNQATVGKHFRGKPCRIVATKEYIPKDAKTPQE